MRPAPPARQPSQLRVTLHVHIRRLLHARSWPQPPRSSSDTCTTPASEVRQVPGDGSSRGRDSTAALTSSHASPGHASWRCRLGGHQPAPQQRHCCCKGGGTPPCHPAGHTCNPCVAWPSLVTPCQRRRSVRVPWVRCSSPGGRACHARTARQQRHASELHGRVYSLTRSGVGLNVVVKAPVASGARAAGVGPGDDATWPGHQALVDSCGRR